MPKLEKYHPILTPHYTLDWLTKARVKDVLTLQSQAQPDQALTMLATADGINQTMREIFHDQKLVWGITQQSNDHLIGQAGFNPLDLTTKTGQLTVTVLAEQATTAVLTELYQRLVDFATHELGLTELRVTLPQPDPVVAAILTQLNFTSTTPTVFTWQV